MPSSISASEHRKATRAITLLLAAMFLYLCALEVTTRLEFSRINHVWRIFQGDHRQAAALRSVSASESATMLIVGNSYLEVGVNRDRLQQEMLPEYSMSYIPMSGTSYLDWYFGLRRLFAEGARPSFVGVCVSTRDLLSDATSGGSFAHAFMLRRDIFRVREDSHLDNTMTSEYFFASFSSWLGHRDEIRNWIFRKYFSGAEDLARHLKPQNQPLPPPDVLLAKALPRLRLLQQLCNENGVHFFLLIPPTRDVRDASNELQEAAAREGIRVILPFQHAELPETAFVDGAHLNPQGAAIFTSRLGPALLQSLFRN